MPDELEPDLIAEVVEDDRSIRCPKCCATVTPEFSQSGPHIKATCPDCKRYLKFARQISSRGDCFIESAATCCVDLIWNDILKPEGVWDE